MDQGAVTILLTSRPGHLRNALQSLLQTMPGPWTVVTADTGLLALKTIRQIQPDLVLVGSGWPDEEVVELVQQVKQEWPLIRCLVLTEQSQQHQQVIAAGADYVMPSGLPIGQIVTILQQMVINSVHSSGIVSGGTGATAGYQE